MSDKQNWYHARCSNCGKKFTSRHSFENHSCVKEAQQMTEAELLAKIKELGG